MQKKTLISPTRVPFTPIFAVFFGPKKGITNRRNNSRDFGVLPKSGKSGKSGFSDLRKSGNSGNPGKSGKPTFLPLFGSLNVLDTTPNALGKIPFHANRALICPKIDKNPKDSKRTKKTPENHRKTTDFDSKRPRDPFLTLYKHRFSRFFTFFS